MRELSFAPVNERWHTSNQSSSTHGVIKEWPHWRQINLKTLSLVRRARRHRLDEAPI